jgi:tetratricopeptide (TPR) repeat protein
MKDVFAVEQEIAREAEVSFFAGWDFTVAERSFRRAIELNPVDAGARHEFSHFLLAISRFKEAETEARLLAETDPVSIDALSHLQSHFLVVRDNARAISARDRALGIYPRSADALRFRQWTYEGSVNSRKRSTRPPDGRSRRIAAARVQQRRRNGVSGGMVRIPPRRADGR